MYKNIKAPKYSRQREAIYNLLKGRFDHPTAETIYNDIRRELPRISLGTVYRDLGVLCGLGKIRKLKCRDGIVRFDADIRAHHHFVCECCGKVSDVFVPDTYNINADISPYVDGTVNASDLYFYGTCRACAARGALEGKGGRQRE